MRATALRLCLPLALCLVAVGCATITTSRLNPLNWFGAGRPVAAEPAATAAPVSLLPAGGVQVVDARVPVAQVTELVVDRTPTGAIVRATGIAPGPGYFNAQLVRVDLTNGVLTYDFRVQAPSGAPTGGSPDQRRITVAEALGQNEAGAIRAVRVRSASNVLQAAR